MKSKSVDNRTVKRSPRARLVADEVIDKLKNKKPINLTKIAVSKGYSITSARSQKPYRTKTFQEAVIPVIERMNKIHEKALINIESRDYSKERLDSVVNVAKQMVHDTRLLQDKSTANVATNIVVYGSNDFLARQLDNNN